MSNREWCKKNCPYEPDCYGWGYDVCNYVISLLKEQENRIGIMARAIEQMPKPTKLLDVFGDGYAKVVRCKDCKHYRYYGLSEETVSECRIDHCENPDADWFCADGERRDDDG